MDKRTGWMRMPALAGLFLCVAAVLVGEAAGPQRDLPAYLWFGNGATDRVTSDGLTVTVNGVTADYIDGSQNVLAIIKGTGNFQFQTQANTHQTAVRSVCMDFGTQFGDQAIPIPFVDGSPRHCGDVGQPMTGYPTGGPNDIAVQNLRYGQSIAKLTRLNFSDGSYAYFLGYGTDVNHDGVLDSPPVIVTCIAPQNPNLACMTWLLAPQNPQGQAVLFRSQILNSKGDTGPLELVGTFTMPFSQTFTRK